jgi:hypothetical protein
MWETRCKCSFGDWTAPLPRLSQQAPTDRRMLKRTDVRGAKLQMVYCTCLLIQFEPLFFLNGPARTCGSSSVAMSSPACRPGLPAPRRQATLLLHPAAPPTFSKRIGPARSTFELSSPGRRRYTRVISSCHGKRIELCLDELFQDYILVLRWIFLIVFFLLSLRILADCRLRE